jgi:hypothetical protein
LSILLFLLTDPAAQAAVTSTAFDAKYPLHLSAAGIAFSHELCYTDNDC